MRKYHKVEDIKIDANELIAKIDGKIYAFELEKISQRLKKSSEKDRKNFVISPSGYGISWPSLDEDLSIDGLLGIKHKPKFKTKKKAS
jgi:hypothetical protein